MILPTKCEIGGEACNANVLYLHPICHVTAPMDVVLELTSQRLTTYCRECGKEVFSVIVANEKEETP